MNNQRLGPWPNVTTARLFLGTLTDPTKKTDTIVSFVAKQVAVESLAAWLIEEGIGPIAYYELGDSWSSLKDNLREDMFFSVGETGMYREQLNILGANFTNENIDAVILKGGALAYSVYPKPVHRTMSDIDLWIQDDDISRTVFLMQSLSYSSGNKEERPYALQKMAGGEIQFAGPIRGLIELHWSPFSGWWITRTTNIQKDLVWNRIEPLSSLPPFYQLSTEDNLLQLGIHLGINHRMSRSAIRGLIDMALTIENQDIDWHILIKRAKKWRVSTVIYMTLDLLNKLIGTADLETALTGLRPSRGRRWLLQRFVTSETVLSGRDLRSGIQRFMFLLLLVDRPRDMIKLVGRTLWPEKEWLAARYGGGVGHWGHLGRVLRSREI